MAAPFLGAVLAGAFLLVIAAGAAWDVIVLVGLTIDLVRRQRGLRPIRIGVEYGVGDDSWFDTAPGPEPYRSFDHRRLLARGDPAATARQVGGALATRLGVVAAVIVPIVAAGGPNGSECHYFPVRAARTACNTIRQATMQWMAVRPGERCPTVEDLKANRDLDTGFGQRDPWGGSYEIRCVDLEIRCTSPGPDGKRGTGDDIVVPANEADATVPTTQE
jgi:hypothetical protein